VLPEADPGAVSEVEELKENMSKLTGTAHGDAANELLGYYKAQARSLEESGHFFMAAVALAFFVETAILAYLLVEFGDDNGGELEIPSSVTFYELLEAAHEIDVLGAPIDVPSEVRRDGERPKHIAKEAADKIRIFRNLIHPARAIKEGYDPKTFTREQLAEHWEMAESITHSLMYHL
jgi:hypothetical protein